MTQALFRSVVAFVLLVAGGVFAFGQTTTTGSINGAIADPSGALVAGANVVAKNNATGQELTTTSSDDGTFVIPQAPAGTYTVTITQQGFKTTVLKDVVVNAGTPSNVKAQLEIGGANETVTITGAGGELLQTTSTTVGQTITGRQITDLPQASRDALDLVLLLPGTQTNGRPRSSTINGLPKGALNITMDGVNVQDNVLKGSDGFFTFVRPRVDAIDEVTISTSTPGAESAGEGAVQIKFVTKGGTSEFHGGLFEYHRNPALNANFWFNNRDLPEDPVDHKAPRTRQLLNQFGGKVGGPILLPGGFNRNRDKLFFFVDYEEYRLPEATLRTRTILSPDAQNGIFTYLAGGVTRSVNLYTLAATHGFPGVNFTTPDPTIASLLTSIRSSISGNPIVAQTDPNVQQVTFQNKGSQLRRFPTGRLDWNVTKNQHVEAIYNYQQFLSAVDFLNNADPAFPGFPVFGSQDSNRFSAVAALRSTITSRLVNEARFGLTGGTVLFFPENGPGQFTNQAGFNLGIGVAASTAANTALITSATSINSPQRRNSPVKQFFETLTYVRGQHNFNFGGNFSQINAWLVSAPNGAAPTVNFSQDSTDPIFALFTSGNFTGASAAQLTAAEQLYRVLTGRINFINHIAARSESGNAYSVDQNYIERYRQREMGLFFQDSWRFRPNLTLNLGLRYDLQYPPTAQNSALSQNTFAGLFGSSGTNFNALFHPGATGGSPTQFTQLPKGQHLYNVDRNNFLPSVGFAWQPDFKNGFLRRLQGSAGQTVIRGGWSMATTREGLNLTSSIVGGNFGALVDVSQITGVNIDYGNLRDRGSLPGIVTPPAPTFPLTPAANGFDIANANAFDPNLKTPYVISFTGGLQRELTKDMVFEIRYVGNRGHQLFRQYGLNEVNLLENGFINEFRLAQQNLAANIAAGRGNTFRYFGAGTGTSPLPVTLAYFRGCVPSGGVCTYDPNNAAQYTSTNFASTTFTNRLSPTAPNAITFVQNLQNFNSTRRGNAASVGIPANFFVVNPTLFGLPGFANDSFYVGNDGKTWYDGMTLELRRRLSQGLLLQGSYTYSKSQANFYASSAVAFSQPGTLRDTWLNKGWSPFDIRHALKLNWIYELPFGNGKRYWSGLHGITDGILGGWSIHGTTRLQSGAPIRFGNVQLVGLTPEDLQKSIEIRKNPNRTVFWLPDDIATNTFRAFSTGPAGFTQGTPTGRFVAPASFGSCIQAYTGQCGFANLILHGPRFLRVDTSLVKKIRITEKTNFELRAEALNLINNINFKVGTYATDAVSVGSAGVPTFTNAAFGQLNSPDVAYRDTSTTNDPGGRIVQLVLRFNF